MTEEPDERALSARASELATTIITICIEMVAPAVLGYWLDQWLNTKIVFAVIGGGMGLVLGLWSLIRLVGPMQRPPQRGDDRRRPDGA